jgi:hypothetical protein
VVLRDFNPDTHLQETIAVRAEPTCVQ